MRRGFAALILGLSLLLATVSWASFTLSRTVLDPGQSERLAERLVGNDTVQQALTNRLADSVDDQLPAGLPVPRPAVEAAAETALADPSTQELLIDAFVQVHQNALNGVSEPVVVDGQAMANASRAALVATRPEADDFLPASPAVDFELPTSGLSWIGSVKQGVDTFTVTTAIAALCGVAFSLLVANNRGAVLRRAALWGLGASLFWLALGYGLPAIGAALSPTSGAIAAAIVDILFGAMIRPATVLAVASAGLFVVGLALSASKRRRGARLMAKATPTSIPRHLNRPSQPVGTATPPAPHIRNDPTTELPRPPKPRDTSANTAWTAGAGYQDG